MQPSCVERTGDQARIDSVAATETQRSTTLLNCLHQHTRARLAESRTGGGAVLYAAVSYCAYDLSTHYETLSQRQARENGEILKHHFSGTLAMLFIRDSSVLYFPDVIV